MIYPVHKLREWWIGRKRFALTDQAWLITTPTDEHLTDGLDRDAHATPSGVA